MLQFIRLSRFDPHDFPFDEINGKKIALQIKITVGTFKKPELFFKTATQNRFSGTLKRKPQLLNPRTST